MFGRVAADRWIPSESCIEACRGRTYTAYWLAPHEHERSTPCRFTESVVSNGVKAPPQFSKFRWNDKQRH